jgi:hypothetical protein
VVLEGQKQSSKQGVVMMRKGDKKLLSVKLVVTVSRKGPLEGGTTKPFTFGRGHKEPRQLHPTCDRPLGSRTELVSRPEYM